ncbi:hypothetical protein, partial [Paraburkholderia hospita]
GRRLKHANKSRMPAKAQANQTACAANTVTRMPAQTQANHPTSQTKPNQTANASANPKKPNRNRQHIQDR